MKELESLPAQIQIEDLDNPPEDLKTLFGGLTSLDLIIYRRQDCWEISYSENVPYEGYLDTFSFKGETIKEAVKKTFEWLDKYKEYIAVK